MKKTLNSTYVRGVLVGCVLASLLLMASTLVHRGISLSFESVYGDEVERIEGRSSLFYETLLSSAAVNSDAVQGPEEEQVTTHSSVLPASGKEPVEPFSGGLTSQEQKKQLLTVIISSRGLLGRTSNRIRSTWGSETENYRIAVGKQGGEVDTTIPNVLVSPHPDYPGFPYLSLRDLVGLINLVRSNFLEYYNWFLFAPTNTYVSIKALERFLHDINPNKVVYIGRPNNSSKDKASFCEGGPGIIFSHMALYQMKGKLQQCVADSKGDLGYRELGQCLLSHLDAKCQFDKDVSNFR